MDTYYREMVVNIFQTLIPALEENPQYRFNWAEVGYLHKWWVQQSTETQERFRKLVENNQIQFVGGGWVQHDEATVQFHEAAE